jgi:hypothetical protein
MERNEKSRVTIEIYDEDGDLRESLGGEYTFRQIRSLMKDIISNDGIPVIRQLGKHAKAEDIKPTAEGKHLPAPEMKTIPMVLEYEFDGIKFHASGNPLDVHCANEALLKRVFEETD